jgi:hypothetical protein
VYSNLYVIVLTPPCPLFKNSLSFYLTRQSPIEGKKEKCNLKQKNEYMYKMGFYPRKKLYKLDYFEEFLCKVNFLICISMAMRRASSISHTLLQLHCSFPALSTFAIQIFLFMLVKYWKKCKTSKLPLIGNLHQLNGGPFPHHGTTELSKKYGPAMQLQVGEKFAVVVSSPEAAKEVFKDKRTQFCSKTCSSGS